MKNDFGYFDRYNDDDQYAIVGFREGGYGLVDRFSHDLGGASNNLLKTVMESPEEAEGAAHEAGY